jgi:hypothetical protein
MYVVYPVSVRLYVHARHDRRQWFERQAEEDLRLRRRCLGTLQLSVFFGFFFFAIALHGMAGLCAARPCFPDSQTATCLVSP